MPRLPRLSSWKAGLTSGWNGTSPVAARPRSGSPSGGSIFTTSAPQSARTAAADGTATQMPSSRTRMPSSGPRIGREPATGPRHSANRVARARPTPMVEREGVLGPTSHYFYSQRLKLHYVDWGNADKPMAILVHGGRDHCRNWDWVALELRRHFHLIAPDLRGHGDSDWAIGGSYAMVDHVLDLYQLINAIAGGPVTLIG